MQQKTEMQKLLIFKMSTIVKVKYWFRKPGAFPKNNNIYNRTNRKLFHFFLFLTDEFFDIVNDDVIVI